jgi:hypothetical protein
MLRPLFVSVFAVILLVTPGTTRALAAESGNNAEWTETWVGVNPIHWTESLKFSNGVLIHAWGTEKHWAQESISVSDIDCVRLESDDREPWVMRIASNHLRTVLVDNWAAPGPLHESAFSMEFLDAATRQKILARVRSVAPSAELKLQPQECPLPQ